MKTRLLNLWESIRTSFWFLPALMVISAILLSFVLSAADRAVALDSFRYVNFLYQAGPEGARSVLSTIAGSMITVAGVSFSITIVALTLASSQFGPRLLRNFMLDVGNQIVLGTFISTFIYCLLVLRTIQTTENHVFVPRLSVTFAIVLALTNVGVLIYFIHHISTSILADRVIAKVYHDLEEHLRRLFPNESGPTFQERDHKNADVRCIEDRDFPSYSINAVRSGYLQAVDHECLMKIACQNDIVIQLRHRPGEFIAAGSPLVSVEADDRLAESTEEQIVYSFIVGVQRTPEQDPEFAIHQLVEVALRALSPGINDPFTAILCIDWLGSALCYLANRRFPSPYQCDEEGKLRILIKPVTFSGIANAAFDQIRQNSRSSIAIMIRLLETLTTIADQTRFTEQQEAILLQAKMIERASHESCPEKHDREKIQQRYQSFCDVLNRRTRKAVKST